MDFFLPALPGLQSGLGIGVELAQATVAVFLVGLAASQLVWAELLARLGPRRTVSIGGALLIVASAGAALAPNIETLIVTRIIQGVAAGSATVVAPSRLLRNPYRGGDSAA